uniref:Ig-like domain-containing protein n=1 Tax=Latimeria chalumnae TaxID=7897 RepID=H2ZX51_LATCH
YPKFRITQPAQISATAGGSVILTCTLSGDGPAGRSIWKKGSGGEERLFYTRSPGRGEQSDSRASFVKDSDRDRSIQITDLTRKDSGTYYCVKLKGDDEELRRGNGSDLSVAAKPSRPSDPTIRGPSRRVEAGQTVNLSCITEGFFPELISITWLKNGNPVSTSPSLSVNPIKANELYRATSLISVTAGRGEIKSIYTCQINHTALETPVTTALNLSDVITVPPGIKLDLLPEAKVNSTVQLHCRVTHYYPQNIRVTWFENERKWENGGSETVHRNEDGSYNLVNSLQLTATKEKNQSVFTCQVVHDSRHHIGNRSVTLRVKAELAEN